MMKLLPLLLCIIISIANDQHGSLNSMKVRIMETANDALIKNSFSERQIEMPQEQTGKIFQPFFFTQIKEEVARLFLFNNYDIIENQERKMRVESKEGEETAFTVILPTS